MASDLDGAAAVPTDQRDAAKQQRFAILEVLLVFARRKRLVLGTPALVGVFTAIVLLFLPNWYSAITRILPPQQTQSNAVAILGQLGALAGGAASQALGLKNPSDVFVAMLKSRTVADSLIKRFDLMSVYDEDLLEEARKELARNSTISASREGIITIEVFDKNPRRAADLANGFVDELRHVTLNLAVGEAAQRRLFFEGQLRKAKDDLVAAEVALRNFSQDSGLVNPQGQLGLTVAAAAALRAQIAAREIQLSAMRSFATKNNPEVQRISQEILGLQVELEKLEKASSASKTDVLVPFGKAPEIGLEYVRRYRELKYSETLFEVLAKQYEIARIDEAKDATLIQVLDVAVSAERKSKPKRALIVIISVALSAVLAAIAALISHFGSVSMQDPHFREGTEELRTLLSLSKK